MTSKLGIKGVARGVRKMGGIKYYHYMAVVSF